MSTLKKKFRVYLDSIYGKSISRHQNLVLRHAFCAGAASGLTLLEEGTKATRWPIMIRYHGQNITQQALDGCVDAESEMKSIPSDASQSALKPQPPAGTSHD